MLPKFEYHALTDLSQALEFLTEHKGAKPVAGGTDLVVQMRAGKIRPKYVADIEGITDLAYIQEEDGVLRIGALTKIEEIRRSETVRKYASNLWLAAQEFATWQVRCVATIGGNLGNASPAADTATPLISLGAEAVLKSRAGERIVPLEEFFAGPGMTVMRPDELLTEIRIPKPAENARHNFLKLGRRTTHVLSIVNVALAIELDGDVVKDVKIALGSVAPKPVRGKSVEEALKGKAITRESAMNAAALVVNDISPITDVRASKEYRIEMSKVLTFRAIKGVMGW